MDITISAWGALIGLFVAIFLIFKKIPPIYSLFIGALLGGTLGGASINETVSLMTTGAEGMMTSILRILAAGVLAGILIKSGAAEVIARTIIGWIGEKRALLALAIASMILTGVGVFIDIAVITVAPIALEIARELNISRSSILVAMIGGGKAGNIISPNPNTIAVSGAFEVELTSVMAAGIIPAICGLLLTNFIANKLKDKGSKVEAVETTKNQAKDLPSFATAISGPLIAILLLVLRPLTGIEVDPMIALPVGGLIGLLLMRKQKNITEYISFGLGEMTGVTITLIGTGALAGIIQHSTLADSIINGLGKVGLPSFLLAPIAGILMSAATASTTSGATVASNVFGPNLIQAGVKPLSAGAMIHAGATTLDHLPHGSFFHATAGCVDMEFDERLSVMKYETLIGLFMTIVSTIIYGLIL